MARGVDFRKPRLEEYTAPSSLRLSQRFRTVHATGYRFLMFLQSLKHGSTIA